MILNYTLLSMGGVSRSEPKIKQSDWSITTRRGRKHRYYI